MQLSSCCSVIVRHRSVLATTAGGLIVKLSYQRINDLCGGLGSSRVINTCVASLSLILTPSLSFSLPLSSDLDMNGKLGGRGPMSVTGEANSNANNISMVSEPSPELQNHARGSRTPKKAATFGKRSNSMRRNPRAEVTKQGWLHKQASSGVKQWNKRWFVLTDRCLFYYKDEKEDVVLGSLPLLSFKISPVHPLDNISRKYAFKVWFEKEEEEEEEGGHPKGSIAFCLQVEHAGTRTYYFSTESVEEQEDWIKAMNEAARFHVSPPTGKNLDDQTHVAEPDGHFRPDAAALRHEQQEPTKHGVNGARTSTPTTPLPPDSDSRTRERLGLPPQHPNGWGSYGVPNGPSYTSQETVREVREVQPESQENTVLRRGFVPRTAPERLAQRKSSMTQLQQWVNQRRGVATQEDLRSPSRYYTVNRGVSADYYGGFAGPLYVEDYPLYPPGVRPDSICSMSAAYDRMPPRWTAEEKRRSLRDGALYGPSREPPREPQWVMGPAAGPHPAYYTQLDSAQGSMRRLSLQPRSRSVPRSPSSSSAGPYSPGPHNFISPARSPSTRFDRIPVGRLREEGLHADPSAYGIRRSLSSPKYDFAGDRRSLSQNMYYNYPASPSLHGKMVPPYHDVYRDLHPTLKLNEIETSKLLNRLCEQSRPLKEQEAVVHRLRMDKDNLESALVATHQEMELCHAQPLAMDKLQLKKESLQNQLISIRGELSQASSALTTSRMESEALEDEVNAIHGDLWEQLNAGGQNEMVHRHLQKEFWRVQDVLEGLHKTNPSRGTDTAKHRASAASGSFSTNSPASPLSSVSLTSPLGQFSPVPGAQTSPTKQLATEHKYSLAGDKAGNYDSEQDKQGNLNKVGIVPPRTKSPSDDSDGPSRRNGKVSNGHISRERPKSAVFPAEVKSKMSVEEQNERLRRNQSSSVRDKRRSLNLSSGQHLDGFKPTVNYRVVRRRMTAHEVDIKDLEAAVRGEGVESPREEIARLRRQVEPDQYDMDIGKELSPPDKVLIPERYLDMEPNTPLSPEEEQEKQKKVERIKTLIAKSNMQNVVPALDRPALAVVNPEQQLQEQEKRIEISCALAAEASRRSRLLSGEEGCRPQEPGQAVAPAV
uniref:PH domain-containing protein n=1 Tax=Electrophorus electricus TaxID=8005 RepID=A0A4W4GFW7_ELEEL